MRCSTFRSALVGATFLAAGLALGSAPAMARAVPGTAHSAAPTATHHPSRWLGHQAAAGSALRAASSRAAAPSAAKAAPTCASGTDPSDFNGDGHSDLAVGAPASTVSGAAGAGQVLVRYGTANGPAGTPITLSQNDISDLTPEAGDGFGTQVRTGDVDGDSCADLVIGTPGDTVGGVAGAGSVQVVFGSVDGLGKGRPSISIDATAPGLGTAPTAGARLGATIALTDSVGSGGLRQLAIGDPSRTVAGQAGAGAVDLVSFADDGSVSDAVSVSQSSPGVVGASETGDHFGAAVDFERDLYSDQDCPSFPDGCEILVTGVPGENDGAGAVVEIDTATATPYDSGAISQDTPGIPGTSEAGDHFGAALDYHVAYGPGDQELAIGAPGEDVGSIKDAGAVLVLDSDWNPLSVTQDTPKVAGAAEAGDQFGSSVLLTENAHLYPSLVVGVPHEDIGSLKDAGAVAIIPVAAGTIAQASVQIDQDSKGVRGVPAAGEHFGAAVGAPDQDLVVGVPDDKGWTHGVVFQLPWASKYGVSATSATVWAPSSGGQFGAAIGAVGQRR